jgi:hypothetical protein
MVNNLVIAYLKIIVKSLLLFGGGVLQIRRLLVVKSAIKSLIPVALILIGCLQGQHMLMIGVVGVSPPVRSIPHSYICHGLLAHFEIVKFLNRLQLIYLADSKCSLFQFGLEAFLVQWVILGYFGRIVYLR